MGKGILWGVDEARFFIGATLIGLALMAPLLRRLVVNVLYFLGRALKLQKLEAIAPSQLSRSIFFGLVYGGVVMWDLPDDISGSSVNFRSTVENLLYFFFLVTLLPTLYAIINGLSEAIVAEVKERADGEKLELRTRIQLVPLMFEVVKVIVSILWTLAFLSLLGVDSTLVYVALSLFGLALALASGDFIANLYGVFVILSDRPFVLNDWVTFDAIDGFVEEISLRHTRVKLWSQDIVTVPNSVFVKTPVVNRSRSRRLEIHLEWTIGHTTEHESLEDLQRTIRRWLRKDTMIAESPVFVGATKFGTGGFTYEVHCFYTEGTMVLAQGGSWEFYNAFYDKRTEVISLVEAAMKMHGLGFAAQPIAVKAFPGAGSGPVPAIAAAAKLD